MGRRKTTWVSRCPKCESEKEREGDSPPRERLCWSCGEWVPYEVKAEKRVL